MRIGLFFSGSNEVHGANRNPFISVDFAAEMANINSSERSFNSEALRLETWINKIISTTTDRERGI